MYHLEMATAHLEVCDVVLQVHLERMPEDSESLGKAVTHALVASVDKIPGVKLGPLKRLQAGTSASFDSMLTAIQQQLATPLIVAFDQLEVSSLLRDAAP